MSFVVVGDANADLRGALPRFPHEGDDCTLLGLSFHAGGSSANVAVALARVGARARLVTRVGVDPAAEIALRAAREARVDLAHVQRDSAVATGICFAAISPGGERTLFGFRGANVALAPVDADAVLDGARWLHVGGHALLEDPQRATALALVDEAERRRVPISLDLCLPLLRAAHGATTVRDLAPRLAALLGNQQETPLLAGDRGPAPLVVEKLGSAGARVITPRESIAIPAFAVDACDTTACGDAFVAGFILAIAGSATPEIAARLGNALGALTATRPGAAESLPSLAEARAFLASRGEHGALGVLREAP